MAQIRASVRAYIAVEREPSDGSWQALCAELGITLLWPAIFERVMAGKADRKKVALIATAHRLIRVMGAMLRSGQAYDADYKG